MNDPLTPEWITPSIAPELPSVGKVNDAFASVHMSSRAPDQLAEAADADAGQK